MLENFTRHIHLCTNLPINSLDLNKTLLVTYEIMTKQTNFILSVSYLVGSGTQGSESCDREGT